MLETVLGFVGEALAYGAVGVLVGWHFPQPVWAKVVQTFVVKWVKVAWNKIRG